jgi:hypothetical protein
MDTDQHRFQERDPWLGSCIQRGSMPVAIPALADCLHLGLSVSRGGFFRVCPAEDLRPALELRDFRGRTRFVS